MRWILRNTEPLEKVRKVFTFDILTVSGDAVRVDRMEADVMPGDIITIKRQPDTVAGAVVLRIDGYLNGKLAACRLNPYNIVQCVTSYLMVNWATLWGSSV